MKALHNDEKPMDRGHYKKVIRESIDSLQDQNPRFNYLYGGASRATTGYI